MFRSARARKIVSAVSASVVVASFVALLMGLLFAPGATSLVLVYLGLGVVGIAGIITIISLGVFVYRAVNKYLDAANAS
jgi:hypothetical protein